MLFEERTVACYLWCRVERLPAGVVLKQVRPSHPSLVPHVETPAAANQHSVGGLFIEGREEG